MKKNVLIWCFAILISGSLIAQDNSLSSLMSGEQKLDTLFTDLYAMEDSPARDSLNNSIIKIFSENLQSENSFLYPWTSLDKIGKVKSGDEKLNAFTWFLQKKDGSYIYYGILQVKSGKKNHEEIKVIPLTDASEKLKHPEMLTLTPENWFGALYYGIEAFTFKRNTYYALFGFDFNNSFSNRKLVEIVTVDHKGEPVFAGDFEMEVQDIKRAIFEYSAQTVMTLRYDDNLKMIVLDHLSPFKPMLSGNYRFYGPDGSYDGIEFKKGTFILHSDVDARNF